MGQMRDSSIEEDLTLKREETLGRIIDIKEDLEVIQMRIIKIEVNIMTEVEKLLNLEGRR